MAATLFAQLDGPDGCGFLIFTSSTTFTIYDRAGSKATALNGRNIIISGTPENDGTYLAANVTALWNSVDTTTVTVTGANFTTNPTNYNGVATPAAMWNTAADGSGAAQAPTNGDTLDINGHAVTADGYGHVSNESSTYTIADSNETSGLLTCWDTFLTCTLNIGASGIVKFATTYSNYGRIVSYGTLIFDVGSYAATSGSIVCKSGSTLTLLAGSENYGPITCESGSILTSGGTNFGPITCQSGSAAAFDGALNSGGPITCEAGCTITFGNSTNEGAVVCGGTVAFNNHSSNNKIIARQPGGTVTFDETSTNSGGIVNVNRLLFADRDGPEKPPALDCPITVFPTATTFTIDDPDGSNASMLDGQNLIISGTPENDGSYLKEIAWQPNISVAWDEEDEETTVTVLGAAFDTTPTNPGIVNVAPIWNTAGDGTGACLVPESGDGLDTNGHAVTADGVGYVGSADSSYTIVDSNPWTAGTLTIPDIAIDPDTYLGLGFLASSALNLGFGGHVVLATDGDGYSYATIVCQSGGVFTFGNYRARNFGPITCEAGGTVEFQGSHNNGYIVCNSGGTVSFDSNSCNWGLVVCQEGTVSFDSDSYNDGAVICQSGIIVFSASSTYGAVICESGSVTFSGGYGNCGAVICESGSVAFINCDSAWGVAGYYADGTITGIDNAVSFGAGKRTTHFTGDIMDHINILNDTKVLYEKDGPSAAAADDVRAGRSNCGASGTCAVPPIHHVLSGVAVDAGVGTLLRGDR